MSQLQRHRERPGIGGASQTPVDGSEAYTLQNMIVDRDGVIRMRPGLVQLGSDETDFITHISLHPSSSRFLIFLTDAFNLKYMDLEHVSYATTLLKASWNAINCKHFIGGGDDLGALVYGTPKLYWMAFLATVGGTKGALWAVDRSMNISEITDANDGYWGEMHGLLNVGTDGNEIQYSDPADSETWPAASVINAPREVGKILAIVPFSDGQSLILGNRGVGLLRGTDEDTIAVEAINGFPAADPAHSAVKCGSRVVWMAPGPRIVAYDGSMVRLDWPVHEEMRDDLSDLQTLRFWWDSSINCYCVGDPERGTVYLFDMDRQRWIGTWVFGENDETLDGEMVGIAYRDTDATPYQRQILAVDDKICEFDYSATADLGSSFTCRIESEPNDLGVPESYKQVDKIYIDGGGTWSVRLYVRATSQAAWSEQGSAVSVTAPGWAYLEPNYWLGERKVTIEANSQAGLFFKSMSIDERVVGLSY